MIRINDVLSISSDEIDLKFIRSSGSGGQNVNKVSTSVQLRFNARHSPSLPAHMRVRLEDLAGSRITKDGVIVISASRYRTQEANRRDALERLIDLINTAARRPRARINTKPSKTQKKRRVDEKTKRGALKRQRGKHRAENP